MYKNVLTPEKLMILHTKSTAVSTVVPRFILHSLEYETAFLPKNMIPAPTIRKSHKHISHAKLSFISGVTLITYHISSRLNPSAKVL